MRIPSRKARLVKQLAVRLFGDELYRDDVVQDSCLESKSKRLDRKFKEESFSLTGDAMLSYQFTTWPCSFQENPVPCQDKLTIGLSQGQIALCRIQPCIRKSSRFTA